MAEPIKISTGKYNKEGKVEVDGKLWTARLIGAGTDLKLRQAQRWIKLLQDKVEKGTATEEDLTKLEGYEKVQYDVFVGMFRDETPDNSEVREWVDNTPEAILIQAFNDLADQTTESLTKDSDGQEKDQKSS